MSKLMTVEMMIKLLSIFDPKMPILIEDADTKWHLNIDEIVDYTDRVLLIGNYNNQYEGGSNE